MSCSYWAHMSDPIVSLYGIYDIATFSSSLE